MPLSRAIIPSPELEEERGKELAGGGGQTQHHWLFTWRASWSIAVALNL